MWYCSCFQREGLEGGWAPAALWSSAQTLYTALAQDHKPQAAALGSQRLLALLGQARGHLGGYWSLCLLLQQALTAGFVCVLLAVALQMGETLPPSPPSTRSNPSPESPAKMSVTRGKQPGPGPGGSARVEDLSSDRLTQGEVLRGEGQGMGTGHGAEAQKVCPPASRAPPLSRRV